MAPILVTRGALPGAVVAVGALRRALVGLRPQLLGGLRAQHRVESLLQQHPERVPAVVSQKTQHFVLVQCNIELSHVRTSKYSC